jgi:hypothetical protein
MSKLLMAPTDLNKMQSLGADLTQCLADMQVRCSARHVAR